jgi:hypothetical protein
VNKEIASSIEHKVIQNRVATTKTTLVGVVIPHVMGPLNMCPK